MLLTPSKFAPDRWWWEYNGSDAALKLLGTDAKAALFNPQSNDDDFTVVGVIAPDTITGIHGCFGKWTAGANARSWMVQQNGTTLECFVTQDGTIGTLSNVIVTSALAIDTKTFFALRYQYSDTPGASSELKFRADGTENSTATAYGPIYSGTGADVTIGKIDTSFFSGNIYWLAYYNRKLTDPEIDGLRNGTINPVQLLQPGDWFESQYKDVGSTLVTEFPQGSAAITFTKEGTPVSGGRAWFTGPHQFWYKPSEGQRWVFDGSSDALRLAAASAGLFDPQSNSDDFTIAGVVTNNTTVGDQGIFCKRNASLASYWLYRNAQSLRFRVSASGAPGTNSTVYVPCFAGTGYTRRFVASYEYIGGASNNIMRLDTADWYGTTRQYHSSGQSAYGPVYSGAIDVQIADFDDSVNRFWDGRIYWLAYWNRKLTDAEMESLLAGAVEPSSLSPDYYEEFNDTPGATQSSEIPTGPTIDFTVEGTPVLEDLSNWADPKSSQSAISDLLDGSIAPQTQPLDLILSSRFFPSARPRATSQVKGVVSMPGVETIDMLGPAGTFAPITRPRSTSQYKGNVSIHRYRRKL